jgi:hypothetical protein
MINPKIFEGVENSERVEALPYSQAANPVPTMMCDQFVEAKFLIKFQADLILRYRLCGSLDFCSTK